MCMLLQANILRAGGTDMRVCRDSGAVSSDRTSFVVPSKVLSRGPASEADASKGTLSDRPFHDVATKLSARMPGEVSPKDLASHDVEPSGRPASLLAPLPSQPTAMRSSNDAAAPLVKGKWFT
jgi:hypothetical protein